MKQKIKMRPDQRKGYFMVLIAGCLWGTNGFFVSILGDLGVQSSTVAFLRLAVAAILLALIMLVMGGKKLFKIDMCIQVYQCFASLFTKVGQTLFFGP